MNVARPGGGGALEASDEERLESSGAIGDVCLNFFDAAGQTVVDDLREQVLGIAETEIRSTPRRIAVAGGERKATAISAACTGQWINVLVTDQFAAERLCR